MPGSGRTSSSRSSTRAQNARLRGLRRARERLEHEAAILHRGQGVYRDSSQRRIERAEDLARAVLGLGELSVPAEERRHLPGQFPITLSLTPEQVQELSIRLASVTQRTQGAASADANDTDPAHRGSSSQPGTAQLPATRLEQRRLGKAVSSLRREQQRTEDLLEQLRLRVSADRGAGAQNAAGEATAAVQEAVQDLKAEFAAAVSTAHEQAASMVRASTDEIGGQVNGLLQAVRDASASMQEGNRDLGAQAEELVKTIDLSASSIQHSSREIRAQLDSLFQDALDLSGKLAHLDADLRSREWLSRLLTLVEGKEDLSPQEVRMLGLNLFDAFRLWSDQHREAGPSGMQRDLENLMSKFRDWRP